MAYHCQLQETSQEGLQLGPGALGLGRAALLASGPPVGLFQALPESNTGSLGLQ